MSDEDHGGSVHHHNHPRLSPGAGRSYATDASRQRPAGFSSRLIDRHTEKSRDGVVRWSAYWELSWEPVPDAIGYLVYLSTMEGTSPVPRLSEVPGWTMEVARGTGETPDPAERESQVSMTASQLQVFVAACFTDGASEPQGPFAVGEKV